MRRESGVIPLLGIHLSSVWISCAALNWTENESSYASGQRVWLSENFNWEAIYILASLGNGGFTEEILKTECSQGKFSYIANDERIIVYMYSLL